MAQRQAERDVEQGNYQYADYPAVHGRRIYSSGSTIRNEALRFTLRESGNRFANTAPTRRF